VDALLTELGIVHEVIDDEAYASCPFHSPDRHPSWSVNLASGVHYCFSCGAKGNLASLVAYLSGSTYSEAVIQVNQAVGWARAHKWREDYDAVHFSPMYLKVHDADMALFTDPPPPSLDLKGMILESARKYEVKWNPAKGTWIFPYRDPYSKELWGWQEKNEHVFRNFPAGTRKSRTLFGLPAVPDGSPLVLVESPADAVVLDSAGIPGGVSSFGVSVSDFQLSLVQQRTEQLVLALDRDNPGRNGARDAIRRVGGRVGSLRVFNYGESLAKDPGEMTYEEIRKGMATAIPAITWARAYDARKEEEKDEGGKKSGTG